MINIKKSAHADRGPRSLCLRMLVGLTLNYIIIEGAVKLS